MLCFVEHGSCDSHDRESDVRVLSVSLPVARTAVVERGGNDNLAVYGERKPVLEGSEQRSLSECFSTHSGKTEV